MKPVKYVLLSIIYVTLAASNVTATEELPAAETVTTQAVVENADTVGREDASSQTGSADVLQSKGGDDNTDQTPAVAAEKPAAVQTASWAEIKRKFRDR